MNSVQSRNSLPKPIPNPKPGTIKVVRALYKYTARQPDELSFEEGDLLYVFDQTNPEWWKARCGSKTGLIPYNYVEGQVEEVREPLHEAARRGNLSFLQECLNQGVSSTGLDSMGNTPLYWASHSGHLDCLECLLKQLNPPLNAQNHFGDTPLHAAASKNHYQVAEILIKHGADPNMKNNNGETPEVLTMDLSLKNLLQMSKSNRNSQKAATFSPEEYEDEDSD